MNTERIITACIVLGGIAWICAVVDLLTVKVLLACGG